MINEEILNREQIFRDVAPIGNGAHIFAPKEWLGERVLVIRPLQFSLKSRILKVVEPYLENILGVYLYGSYARNEQTQDSDIDILIISNNNFKIKEKGFEIIVLEKNKIKDAIKIAPILIYSALREAKPIINSELLENLKRTYKPKIQNFKDYIKETKEIIKINEDILDPYSIILRLRGIFLIEGLFSEKIYSHKSFKEWIFKDADDKTKKIDFDSSYDAYLRIKKDLRGGANESNLKILLSILKIKTRKLEKKIYG
jgi:predicted nucleotidyltransferase